MSRSKWKGPFICTQYLTEIKLLRNNQTIKKHLTISRNSEIVPAFVGLTFLVHNGKIYSEVTVSDNMVGHKFGEFSFTRAKFIYKKKKLKSGSKNKS
jgi:small subunit ribosomal protein S19